MFEKYLLVGKGCIVSVAVETISKQVDCLEDKDDGDGVGARRKQGT